MQAGRRPVFLNLLQIRFPVTAITSILHRASGLLLFLLIPFLILALQMSLRSTDDFNSLLAMLNAPVVKLLLFIILWAGLHHLLAGVRFLLLDIDVGVSKARARSTAWLVNILALLLALLICGAGL
jgi:succinate dehydrogenase / fumarate reductase cytochrome b subunit